jgi:Na+-translocating ferredoxin:NAD+ oxidoreductase RnfG subunit
MNGQGFGALMPLAALAAASMGAAPAFAIDYMNAEQARKLFFPAAAKWQDKVVTLDAAQLRSVAERAGMPARSAAWSLSNALDDKGAVIGTVVVDQVIGKFELITYAVGLDRSGAIAGIEILSYRESHGSEIRLPAWRRQFAGKSLAQPIKAGEDIAIISGATLSCNHVTDGVRRIVALVAMLRDGGLLAAP